MLDDMPQVNLVAMVGAGGSIGPSGGLPCPLRREEAETFQQWFLDLTRHGIIVIGYRTLQIMRETGFVSMGSDYLLVCWNRDGLYDPDQFLEELKRAGKPIFICGGRKTYETFMPHVQQFFIRRVALSAPHDHFMPALFGRMQ
ncbi:dihydrofolate reductase [Synechococcus virus S-ESS1]|uniref:Dihydrofolate reductase n=1 Tax=Synechococcus virus S-ESS1 TaxID=1964565 RepID=A0A1V0DX41_9CAUD|nr:dihydrofolate reductase [Synechococcus virus S-ESS1]ARB05728.1 dihydrofolate reductase [Synechococcus virus S-ESS1]